MVVDVLNLIDLDLMGFWRAFSLVGGKNLKIFGGRGEGGLEANVEL
jgi:hypothetical protein